MKRFILLALLCVCTIARAAQPSVYLEELTSPEIAAAIAGGATTAIYYAGSTEQNGPHLVTGKHNIVARHVAGEVARALGNALVYPVMPFAPTGDASARTGHMAFAGSVTVSDATYAGVARDVAASARASGFRTIVLMGDHGGGQQVLQQVAAQLDAQWRNHGVRVFYVGDVYFAAEKQVEKELAALGVAIGAHAGAPDTAELLYLDREGQWVRKELIAAAAKAPGVDGDPSKATVELGRRFVEIKVQAAVAQIRRLIAGAR